MGLFSRVSPSGTDRTVAALESSKLLFAFNSNFLNLETLST